MDELSIILQMRILTLLHKDRAWRIILSETRIYSMEFSMFPESPNFVAIGYDTRVNSQNKKYNGIQTTSIGVHQANLGKNQGTQKITNPY